MQKMKKKNTQKTKSSNFIGERIVFDNKYRKFNDFIIVSRSVRNNRGQETSLRIEEDCVRDKSSATMIVNHLIKKFDLEYWWKCDDKMVFKNCVNCGEEFEAYDKPHLGHRRIRKFRRGSNCLTCSSKCSREYNRGRNRNKFAKFLKDDR